MKFLIKDSWSYKKEEVIKQNDLIKQKIKGLDLSEFWIYGKKVYSFKISYCESLGFVVNYNLRKRKKEGFKYYCRGNFLVEDNKITFISDFNYTLIKDNEDFNILPLGKEGYIYS
jgi:hypothetical protein